MPRLFPSRSEPFGSWLWVIVPAAVIVIALAIARLWFSEDIEVDSCLDAGGRYDYAAKTCEVDCTSERWNHGPLEGWRCAPAMTDEQARAYFRQFATEIDCSKPETLDEVAQVMCKIGKRESTPK